MQLVDESVIYSFDPLFSVSVPSVHNTSAVVVKYIPYKFDVYMSRHRQYISEVQPTRSNVLVVYLFL